MTRREINPYADLETPVSPPINAILSLFYLLERIKIHFNIIAIQYKSTHRSFWYFSFKILSAERDTFYLTMLASIEVGHHKGNDVLVQAMNKVKEREGEQSANDQIKEYYHALHLGIHVIDKRKKNFFQCPTFDFFYSLQNISFCGAHPKQLKYFGFITKHPLLPRFACHVFMSSQSTQPIVESIG
uniref:PID domain-containing protein n=1 Tax=Heterorhabditis bacteriophora TaxID=37862 RepID=A0A1I7X0T0_HETBA